MRALGGEGPGQKVRSLLSRIGQTPDDRLPLHIEQPNREAGSGAGVEGTPVVAVLLAVGRPDPPRCAVGSDRQRAIAVEWPGLPPIGLRVPAVDSAAGPAQPQSTVGCVSQ